MKKLDFGENIKNRYMVTKAELNSFIKKGRTDFSIIATLPKGVIIELKK